LNNIFALPSPLQLCLKPPAACAAPAQPAPAIFDFFSLGLPRSPLLPELHLPGPAPALRPIFLLFQAVFSFAEGPLLPVLLPPSLHQQFLIFFFPGLL
jgi:hypothetical protein